jgi:L-iditol 2-dehydrogenase
MLQSFLLEAGNIVIRDGIIPTPKNNEVLVRIQRAGICGSDLHLYQNGHSLPQPLTIGHEAIGFVEAVGADVSHGRIGVRVVIEPNIPCKHCPECKRGFGHVCRNKRIIGVNEHGCFTQFMVIPSDFAHNLPDEISDNDAVTIEPAAVALAALRRSGIPTGESIAVIGLGAIGMLVCHIGMALGYKVYASDPVPEKRNKAANMGVQVIEAGTLEVLEECFTEAQVLGVFECAGASKTAETAISSAPRGASIILLGLSETPAQFVPKQIARKGNTIIPSLIYDHPTDFHRCLDLIDKGIIHPGFIVEQEYLLEDLSPALNSALDGKTIKVALKIVE